MISAKEGSTIINLKLIRNNGDVKFKAYGFEIDEHFVGEYEEGDKWRVEVQGTRFVKMKLDSTLNDSIVYIPDGVFEFAVPVGYELDSCYHPSAFRGDDHRIICSEPDEC